MPPLPSVSLVTPVLNRAALLPAAMDSVLGQQYPRLEYVVVDGGSTDGTVEVIRAREAALASWSSEPDGGIYDALQKGFARTTGEVMGWLGSDDLHLPWTLSVVGEVFAALPEVQWLTTSFPVVWDARGRAVRAYPGAGHSRRAFLAGDNLPRPGRPSAGFIQQESTFWRRTLWERAGSRLDTGTRLAGDLELWARFFEHAQLHSVDVPLAGFRVHGEQQSAQAPARYVEEAVEVLRRHGGRPAHVVTATLRAKARPAVPSQLVPALARLRLVHPRPVVRWSLADARWETAVR